MKKLKIIIILLAAVLAFSAACGKSPGGSRNPGDEVVPTIDTDLVKNGISPYKIVLPEGASKRLQFAANELQYFFSLSTGVTLPIVGDNTVTDAKGMYLSLGDTKISRAAGLTLSYSELDNDGYKVRTYGNAVAMAGARDDGTVYAVYGYLSKQFRLKIFTADFFTYDIVTNAKLADLNYTDIPDIPFRVGGTYLSGSTPPWGYDSSVIQRSRYRERYMYGDGWGQFGHTHFGILPPAKYFNSHPDWYYVLPGITNPAASDALQLNWTNTEMWDEFTENLKQIILESDPASTYFQLGHMDNGYEPIMGDYNAVKAANGDFASAVELIFLNYVVRKINEWSPTAMPGRSFEFSMFAYGMTEAAPVKTDNGKYVPYNENCVPEDNLGIMIAPIMSHSSHGYLDETNGRSKGAFEGWGAIAKKLHVWAYSTYFGDYLAPTNSWGSIKQNYMDYKRLGVSYLFEQGITNRYVPNFLELRQYLVSQLSWNTSLDTEVLILDFIKAYYGAGWQYVYEYFNLLRNHMCELEVTHGVYARYNEIDYIKPEWFPKPFLDQCEKLFDKALAAAEEAGDERAYSAIERDRMPLRYLIMSMYCSYYDPAVYRQMANDFQSLAMRIGFTYLDEWGGRSVADLVKGWLDKLA